MSDTGGGHRAAAEAIRDALYERYGTEQVQTTLVDVFKESRFPYNYMPDFYPWIVNHGKTTYAISYRLSDTKQRTAVLARWMYMINGPRYRKMARENPADVVVSTHSILTRPMMHTYARLPERPPFLTVITDLVTTHHFWYEDRSEFTFAPTQFAYDRGVEIGMPADKMSVVGLPVHPHFIESLVTRDEARQQLGWDPEKPTILMVAGGDGMGSLYETACAINQRQLDCQLAIVAGRNESLRSDLKEVQWNQATHIYGFVTNMPVLMAGADIMVTKAGPATITEASIAGLPMILNDRIPGQEDGNIIYVAEHNAGVYAPEPEIVASTVVGWLSEGREGLQRRSKSARKLSNPQAVWEIADAVWEWAQHPLIVNERRRWKRRT
ncbi:galactosyldiacylglycerol synthase [Phototrophicus methaneseepsis]|uniref:Galactosyldiacylglycerol synthase n=1 Tax=Phototrophicus methaneseepsis TaxID=2710758 RepID=A0A7S8ED98_9CHLR|nr:glycosyltransferase [Phototrophicus methaneseepsis]QPC84847.1 galactosyldiacylglycerol synthase [Phototrophicus methaneseepsis]